MVMVMVMDHGHRHDDGHDDDHSQRQLNFAIWCATTGCGISINDHLTLCPKLSPLAVSFYRFHVYFKTRKILNEMKCSLPVDDVWNVFENLIDMKAYEQMCNEFGVPLNGSKIMA